MNEIDELKKKIRKILQDETISGYRLSEQTGINRSMISRYRSKKHDLSDMTLSTAEKILKYK